MKLFDELNSTTNKEWFISGTRGMGLARDESDLDIVLPIWHKDLIDHFNKKQMILTDEKSDYFGGVKVRFVDDPEETKDFLNKKVNFIFLHQGDFLAWALTTKQMRVNVLFGPDSIQSNPLFNKEKRVQHFEILKAMNRVLVGEIYMADLDSKKHIWYDLQEVWNKPLTQKQIEAIDSILDEEDDVPF